MRKLKYIGMALLSVILFSCTNNTTKETVNFNIPKGFKLVNATRNPNTINIFMEAITDSTYIPTTKVLEYINIQPFHRNKQTIIFKEFGSKVDIKSTEVICQK